MNNHTDANGGIGNQNVDGNQDHQIPQCLLQLIPRPRDVTFTLTEGQLQLMYITWAGARMRMCQEVYRPEVPLQPRPQPPVFSECFGSQGSTEFLSWRCRSWSISWDFEVQVRASRPYGMEVRGWDKVEHLHILDTHSNRLCLSSTPPLLDPSQVMCLDQQAVLNHSAVIVKCCWGHAQTVGQTLQWMTCLCLYEWASLKSDFESSSTISDTKQRKYLQMLPGAPTDWA
ncbi:hypothetical protein EV424DRAFT_1349733 [Suillus variegatus]|nr:hypothetical protein EV424DRAFT_1349733 [Suillus variegatus]